MQTQEYFRRCKVSFENLTKNLLEIYDVLPYEYKEEYYEDSFDNFKRDFNFLLQGVLLDFALNTTVVEFLEMLYIADIGDNDVRLDLHLSNELKQQGSEKWKLIYFLLEDAEEADLVFFKENVASFLKPVRETMLKSFAVADYLSYENFHLIIADDLVSIIENFLKVNCKEKEISLKEAVDKMNAVLFEPVASYVQFAKAVI